MNARTDRRAVFNIAFCLTTYFLFALNWLWGGLRFTSARLNVLTLAAALLLPVLSFYLLTKAPRARQRPLLFAGLAPLVSASLAACLMVLFIGSETLFTNRDGGEPLQNLSVGKSLVRAYRSHGDGITVDHRLVIVQQECPLFSDLIWVTRLHEEHYADQIRMTKEDNHSIRCLFDTGKPSVLLKVF